MDWNTEIFQNELSELPHKERLKAISRIIYYDSMEIADIIVSTDKTSKLIRENLNEVNQTYREVFRAQNSTENYQNEAGLQPLINQELSIHYASDNEFAPLKLSSSSEISLHGSELLVLTPEEICFDSRFSNDVLADKSFLPYITSTPDSTSHTANFQKMFESKLRVRIYGERMMTFLL